MSQESTTKQMSYEFTKSLPNHPQSELHDKVVTWMSNNSILSGPVTGEANSIAGPIVSTGDTQIKPDGTWVNMRLGFTIQVYVKKDNMKITFTNLRRLYGSTLYDTPLNDGFFRTSTGIPYHQAARQRFILVVQSLSDFITQ